ncbi:GNAT family N-acetyltransferase [Phenylobacterium sp.]|uniref:GNAT family N-acetyltransferase n=1 Tax=Phenylobacterium sp. TaxID=1871053 RepID=UPI002F931C02
MNLRRAGPTDAQAIAALLRHTFRVSLPFLPELHTPEQDLWFVREQMLVKDEVWLAEDDEQALLGFVAFREGWIDHLYVHPDHQGQGIGELLLRKPLRYRQARRLWTFQKNARARAFYEKHGFQLVELTDGQSNEEKEPDALYEWRP